MNPSEKYMDNFIYDGHLANFLYRDVGKKLNMSWDDFINRPRHEIEAIFRVMEDIDKRRESVNESLLKDLEKTRVKSSKE